MQLNSRCSCWIREAVEDWKMNLLFVVGCKIPRTENSPIFLFFGRPPLPVSPGYPEVDPTMDQNRRSGLKQSGWLKHLAGFTRKKASTRRVNRKIANSTRNQRVFVSRYLAANYGRISIYLSICLSVCLSIYLSLSVSRARSIHKWRTQTADAPGLTR